MNRILNVTRLHYVKRSVLLTPVAIMALVVVITCLIAFIMQRAGMDTTSPEWEQGFQNNGGAIWSFPGFFVYLGVQAVSLTFPYGMALGTTRKSYALGTGLFYVVQSIYTALLGLVLYGIERLTDGWFVNSYVFNVTMLGSGNLAKLLLMLFSISFFALCAGGVFGALFVRLGSRGPLFLGIAMIIALGVLLLIFAPNLGAIFSTLTIVKFASALLLLAVASVVGQYVALRSATVR